MMIWRYSESVRHPFKMKANRELMMLQKVLLRDAFKNAKDLQAKTPLERLENLKRIEIYDDELKFPHLKDKKAAPPKIEHVAMSSEPHRNFFLIAMQGVVYKYDLVTKELLFQFKSPCSMAL